MSEMHIQQLPSIKPVSLGGAAIADAGKVRLGGHAPSLPPVRITATETNKVSFGGHAPSLPPVRITATETNKVSFGGHAPSLPR